MELGFGRESEKGETEVRGSTRPLRSTHPQTPGYIVGGGQDGLRRIVARAPRRDGLGMQVVRHLYLVIRKSTPPQNPQLNNLIGNIIQQVDSLMGQLTL